MGLAFASFALTISLFAVIVVLDRDRDDSMRARANELRSAVEETPTALASRSYISVRDRPAEIVTLMPLSPAAPLPPGVAAWPKPGEAVFSPQLLTDLGPSMASRVGLPVGRISRKGLVSPTDRLVYRVPPAELRETANMQEISGFGLRENQDSQTPPLSRAYQAHVEQTVALVGFGTIVPSLIGIALVGGLDGEDRARRAAVLELLGASSAQRRWLEIVEVWRPLVVGVGLGSVVMLALTPFSFQVGWLDAVVSGSEILRPLEWLPLTAIAALTMALALVVLVRPRAHRWIQSADPGLRQARGLAPRIRAAICVAAAGLAIFLPSNFSYPPFRVFSYLLALMLFVVTFPAALGALIAGAGNWLGDRGFSSGRPGQALGGRRLSYNSRRTARILLGVCSVILILGQVQLWASILGAQHRDAQLSQQVLGDVVLVGSPPEFDEGLTRFLQEESLQVAFAWMWVELSTAAPSGSSTVVMQASCETIKLFSTSCEGQNRGLFRESAVGRSIGGLLGPRGELRRSDSIDFALLEARSASLVLISRSGEELDALEISFASYDFFATGLMVESTSQGWVTAGQVVVIQARWVVAIGMFGVLVLTLATGCSLAGDVLRSSREMRRRASETEGRSWVLGVVVLETMLPLVVGGWAAGIAYYVLPTSLRTGDSYVSPSLTYVALVCSSSLAIGFIVAVLVARLVIRDAPAMRSI